MLDLSWVLDLRTAHKLALAFLVLPIVFITNYNQFLLSKLRLRKVLVDGGKSCTGYLRLPSHYSPGAVFQSAPDHIDDASALGPNFYGFSSADPRVCPIKVEVTLKGLSSKVVTEVVTAAEKRWKDGYLWTTTLPAGRNGDKAVVNVTNAVRNRTLEIVYGDVWVCTGQSNMAFGMRTVRNGSNEMKDAKRYKNIRMLRLTYPEGFEPEEQEDVIIKRRWGGTVPLTRLRFFSAPCFLFARSLSDEMSRGKSPEERNKHVFGMIQVANGGVRTETFMAKEYLDKCFKPGQYIPPHNYIKGYRAQPSHVWKTMIHPLTRHSIYGIISYQGESNALARLHTYSCLNKQFILNLRDGWSKRSLNVAGHSDAEIPFGVVQLGLFDAFRNVAFIRWHQTGDVGYLPNHLLPRTFMAVTVDTHDKYESMVHPQNKQLIMKRLAYSAMNVAYNRSEYPIAGPFPTAVQMLDNATVVIKYDQDFVYTPGNRTVSCYFFCTSGLECEISVESWHRFSEAQIDAKPEERIVLIDTKAPIGLNQSLHEGQTFKLAYCWDDCDLVGYPPRAPIYGLGPWILPAAPYKSQTLFVPSLKRKL